MQCERWRSDQSLLNLNLNCGEMYLEYLEIAFAIRAHHTLHYQLIVYGETLNGRNADALPTSRGWSKFSFFLIKATRSHWTPWSILIRILFMRVRPDRPNRALARVGVGLNRARFIIDTSKPCDNNRHTHTTHRCARCVHCLLLFCCSSSAAASRTTGLGWCADRKIMSTFSVSRLMQSLNFFRFFSLSRKIAMAMPDAVTDQNELIVMWWYEVFVQEHHFVMRFSF